MFGLAASADGIVHSFAVNRPHEGTLKCFILAEASEKDSKEMLG